MAYTQKSRVFGRTASQRQALMRSLARSLIMHERISTTEAKAKSLRPFVERLVSHAKMNTLSGRRLIQSRIGDIKTTKKLIDTIGPRYATRAGGYTRIVKRAKRSTNDARKLAYISFV